LFNKSGKKTNNNNQKKNQPAYKYFWAILAKHASGHGQDIDLSKRYLAEY